MDSETSRSIYNAFRNITSGFRSPSEMEMDPDDYAEGDERGNYSEQEEELARQFVSAHNRRRNHRTEDVDEDEESEAFYHNHVMDIKPEDRDPDEVAYHDGLAQMDAKGLVDIGNLASWEVSSSKSGFDCLKMREDSPKSYWQSDGSQPHSILIKFAKSVNIKCISIFLNYTVDESYTPEHVVFLAGTGEHDLLEVVSKQFIEPVGWQNVEFDESCPDALLSCYLLKIKFLSNHQNGKDCHVRGIKIFSPVVKILDSNNTLGDDCVGFTSNKLIRESMIR